jgi:hypothetical protein
MWRDITAKLERLQPLLPREWLTRLATAAHTVETLLGDTDLVLSTAHRDFGPWNTRVTASGRLFVFDWDVAHREMSPLYDLIGFHFLNATSTGTRRPAAKTAQTIFAACRRWAPEVDPALVPALLLAYMTECALGRLMGAIWRSDLASDTVLQTIAALLDRQGEWLSNDRVAPA